MTIKPVLSHYEQSTGKRAVRIYINHEGKTTYRKSGLSCHPKDWNEEKKEFRRSVRLHRQLNAKLKSIIHEIEDELMSGVSVNKIGKGSKDLVEYLSKYIEEEKVLSAGTMKHYRSLHKHLEIFLGEQRKTKLDFTEIDRGWAYEFNESMKARGVGPSGIRNVWKKLKKIIRQAYNEGLHGSQAWQDITLPKERKPGKIYLSEKEVEQLRNIDLSHKPGLERSRDVWIIAYDLFMRYCDVIRIEQSMVFSDKDGTQYLRYISQKTSTVAAIPLRKKTIELIEKYDWRLDIVTNQQLNRDIKRIASMANINQVVSQDREKAPKCEFITAHTARRSAATNAQLREVDLRTIQHVGGWKDIKTVEVYLRASNVTVAVNAAKHSFFRD